MLSNVKFSVDTEYQPQTDQPTIPISVQIKPEVGPVKFFIHPQCPLEDSALAHPRFSSPFAPIDYLGLPWRLASGQRSKNYLTVEAVVFFSFKDIEFLFSDRDFYSKHVLPQLERTRRIRTASNKGIGLPWEVYLECEDGRQRWVRLSLLVTDICAMQGASGLASYAANAEVEMQTKEIYTRSEKARMLEMYLRNPEMFVEYANGDAVLIEIREKTDQFYNRIAKILGIESRETWGLSTGKIVASMVSAWMAKLLGVNDISRMTQLAGANGIVAASKIVREKKLLYTSMTDGGRAVKERSNAVGIEGLLVDIDIAGCYGNGLKNQKFAVGNPTIIHDEMPLRDFLNRFKRQLVPGLWYARVSWDNSPFSQDLLISKVEREFTLWENGLIDENPFGDDRVYDASMVLTNRSVRQAAINHDLLQALQDTASNQEWSWILDNCRVETAAMYLKRHQVKKPTRKMLKGIRLSTAKNVTFEGTKEWVEVDLAPLMETLLKERAKAKLPENGGKGGPMDQFLKLIINTIYGTIASSFFSEPGTGISNAVVGNNITARARTLAWCMAKGLHSWMTVTDGGVFDVNSVLAFERKSLTLFEGLHRDEFQAPNRHTFARKIPLFDRAVTKNEMPDLMKEVDSKAWQHLKSQFPNLDIFKFDQFGFESKNWYTKLTIHSKVNYRLIDTNGKEKIAFRGFPKEWSDAAGKKIVDARASNLFDALENNKPNVENIETTELLSLADWKRLKDSSLLPHDERTDIKRFFSHIPLGNRFSDLTDYKAMYKAYESAKKTGDPNIVASL